MNFLAALNPFGGDPVEKAKTAYEGADEASKATKKAEYVAAVDTAIKDEEAKDVGKQDPTKLTSLKNTLTALNSGTTGGRRRKRRGGRHTKRHHKKGSKRARTGRRSSRL